MKTILHAVHVSIRLFMTTKRKKMRHDDFCYISDLLETKFNFLEITISGDVVFVEDNQYQLGDHRRNFLNLDKFKKR